MISCRNVLVCVWGNFKKWGKNTRIIVLLLTIAAFGFWDYTSISAYAREIYGGMTSWVLPFYLRSPVMIMVYCCITTAFFGNAPFADRQMPFTLIRVGRRPWMIGQFLYIWLAGLVYVMIYLVVSIVFMLPSFDLSNDWGTAVRALAVGDVMPSSHLVTLGIHEKIVRTFTPIEATVITCFLMWMVAVFMANLIMVFNLASRGTLGIPVTGLLIFLMYFWSYFGQMWFGEYIYWFSPFSWCSMFMVDFWNQGIYPPLGYVTAVLLGGSLAMGVISTVIYCKKDVHMAKEEF